MEINPAIDYLDVIEQMTPQVYENLKRSLELGKWPSGSAMDSKQKEHCMQAIIAYDALHVVTEHRVGYIDREERSDDHPVQTLKWRDQEDDS